MAKAKFIGAADGSSPAEIDCFGITFKLGGIPKNVPDKAARKLAGNAHFEVTGLFAEEPEITDATDTALKDAHAAELQSVRDAHAAELLEISNATTQSMNNAAETFAAMQTEIDRLTTALAEATKPAETPEAGV